MGTVRGREVRFRLYPHDHLPVHAHGKIGAGEVVVEILAAGRARLSLVHGESVRGDVKDNEIRKVVREATELAREIRAEWGAMHK